MPAEVLEFISGLLLLFAFQMDEFIFEDCGLICVSPSKYKDFGVVFPFEKCLPTFISKVIIPHEKSNILVCNFHHMHVFVARESSCQYLKGHERSWSDILPADLLAEMKKYGAVVLGFMVLKPAAAFKLDKNEYAFVDMIETRLPGHNIATKMMERMKDKLKVEYIIPSGISNASYWKKYYSRNFLLNSLAQYRAYFDGIGVPLSILGDDFIRSLTENDTSESENNDESEDDNASEDNNPSKLQRL